MALAAGAGRPAWLRVLSRIVALAIATEEQMEFVHAVVAEEVDLVISDANRATTSSDITQ